jgi:hypothetical protein
MNSVHTSRANRLARAYVEELAMDKTGVIYGAICKVTEAKNTDEKLRSLEFLLQTVLKGQGKEDFLYDQYNY